MTVKRNKRIKRSKLRNRFLGESLEPRALLAAVVMNEAELLDALAMAEPCIELAADIMLSGTADITNPVVIEGSGFTVDASAAGGRAFNIDDGAASDIDVEFRDTTITGGLALQGGAIFNAESLTLTNATLTGNTAASAVMGYVGTGGAVATEGPLTLNGSTITGNSADHGGGLYVAAAGSLTAYNSTVEFNDAQLGGGIYALGDVEFDQSLLRSNVAEDGGGVILSHSSGCLGTATFTNSTIYNNTAYTTGNVFSKGGGVHVKNGNAILDQVTISTNVASKSPLSSSTNQGGGIFFNSPCDLTILKSTVTLNNADGGGLFKKSGDVVIEDSIVAENFNNTTASDIKDDNATTATTATFTLVGIDTDNSITNTGGNIVGIGTPISPMLDPIANNFLGTGTPTAGQILTHDPQPTSPAVDAADPLSPLEGTLDQRAGSRIEYGPSADLSIPPIQDMGAVERGPDCDYDDDGGYDCSDLALLGDAITTGTNERRFDVDGDGDVDANDGIAWLDLAYTANTGNPGSYLQGDANLDGTVDGQDFILWNQNKFTVQSSFCLGDFNFDGFVDGSDFIVWNQNKFQSSDAAVVVPQPLADKRVEVAKIEARVTPAIAADSNQLVALDSTHHKVDRLSIESPSIRNRAQAIREWVSEQEESFDLTLERWMTVNTRTSVSGGVRKVDR